MNRPAASSQRWSRYQLVLWLMFAGFCLLATRAFYLQILDANYLQEQGDARHLRTVEDDSHRGMILDRNGEPLAISTPVDSVWANPDDLAASRDRWPALTRLLGISAVDLAHEVKRQAGREFMYVKRQIAPETAKEVMALDIPGIALQREYRRYYPAGPVAAHVIGFTNVDDEGQEGIELAYNNWLRGMPGKKRVLKDRYGNIVETVESISLPVPGKNLTISIDQRIQYLAYRALKAAIAEHHARAASAIVLDARTGEVLALVNEPSFNPNNRSHLRSKVFRDRAVNDEFEPGSTLKPFTIAAALETGRYFPGTTVNTAPGSIQIGHYTIRDERNYGLITVAQVIEHSSNVGATKIALSLNRDTMWNMFRRVGFGQLTGIGLPGEAPGFVNPSQQWVPVEQATMSFGYGISVTPLQLAQAYGGLANDGVMMPVTLLRRDQPVAGRQIMSAITAHQVRAMLELAVSPDGTGAAAQVANYQVAGKTGTSHKLGPKGYEANNYIASFAGFVPASDPRLVMVIVVNNPTGGAYYGGQIAAPVFSKVMTGALRLLNIPPDNLPQPKQWMAQTATPGSGTSVQIVSQRSRYSAKGAL
ncbi:MAG: peptidoglycan D,D-transpeptidase FtsI family protein [Acidiferrobacterales bacterium]